MKRWLWLFFIPSLAFAQTLGPKPGTGGTVTSITCNGVVITNSGTCSTVGQIPGTTTNDSATAGNVGEFQEATFTTIAVGGSNTNLTTLSLTAGDWDVEGHAIFASGAASSITGIFLGINNVTATLPALGRYFQSNAVIGASASESAIPPVTRYSLASTTTIYLVGQSTLTGSATASGFLRARRVR